MNGANLFADIPASLPEEFIEVLAEGSGKLQVERIVSRGHASPPGFWYEQETTEFVVLLKGSATLRFDDGHEPYPMGPGDWVTIPKGHRHRVETTSAGCDTVWIAVHWG